ncbi:sensor histidine kinase [Paracidovorax avenae]|uniref:sensor histidine kinase n=1 Tax=Paracidovorax avenae TaxID=80867 RepID=UPI000D214A3A|nr:HAMP domain-containing sensor histidine kinase [Paracidovorax avenae]AVS84375.1 sensor histidine kinase [Paracidovorax avenae]AVS95018.1 sensor histidine kinase [Paracidovorax avenae]AVT01505.1 sensor histidine kinase [Paracidovorax avenae]AVT08584.1 sensor histidine kinase [Paracidovorax avenae]
MVIHTVLALALIETLALSTALLVWARQVEGARLLAVFLLGVGTWIVGNELPNWVGIASAPWALALLATVPLTSAAFLHFCALFTGWRPSRGLLAAAYGAAAAAVAISLYQSPGTFVHFPAFTGVQWVVVPNHLGWTTSLVWAGLAGGGLLLLARAFWRSPSPAHRRQIAAVALSCGWGLMCISGYGFAALGIAQYPWQVLAFPAYPVILVYGILRYRVFVANAWARRALAWALLTGLGLLAVPLSLLLPLESRWVTAAVVAAVCLSLGGPVRRLAERIVYPGGTPTADDLHAWRHGLSAADSLAQLAQQATALLSGRMGLAVQVRVEALHAAAADPPGPELVCTRDRLGSWHTALRGFEQAPPGPRHLAELFGSVLADAAGQVERAAAAGQRERERQTQARLAELGALAASVAHDVRNPLNIIAMAAAFTAPEPRQEIQAQIARIARLADDLLDYARPWQIRPEPVDLCACLRDALRHLPDVERGPGLAQPLPTIADSARVDQAITNLLANARTAASGRRVHVDAERTAAGVLVHVCDDGPGVPPDLRERIFEPFASRSPGGTGLGLAIVARIMAAHGGSVTLAERAPWTTCFTLTFPASA